MNKEIKAKWVAALRSGKYRRGQAYLERKDKYCCLGVLCKEMGYGMKDNQYLTDWQLKRSGLTEEQQNVLALANDGELKNPKEFKGYRRNTGASFKSIANWIEKNL